MKNCKIIKNNDIDINQVCIYYLLDSIAENN
jgi:hypothetical protein